MGKIAREGYSWKLFDVKNKFWVENGVEMWIMNKMSIMVMKRVELTQKMVFVIKIKEKCSKWCGNVYNWTKVFNITKSMNKRS